MASNKISQFIDGVVVDGLSFLNSKEEITEGCRLFREIIIPDNYERQSYSHTGFYKEIKNPLEFKKNDPFIGDFWYIREQGFLIKHKANE